MQRLSERLYNIFTIASNFRSSRRSQFTLVASFFLLFFILRVIHLDSILPRLPALPKTKTIINSFSRSDNAEPRAVEFLRSSKASRFPYPITPLINRLNAWGVIEKIEYPDGGGFNPSLLSLPVEGFSNGPLAVVAREHDPSLWENDPSVRPRWLIAAMLELPDMEEDARSRLRWSPVFDFKNDATPPVRLESLVHNHTATLFPKCDVNNDLDKWFRNVQGPEDPRLFWTHMGEPLVIYNSFAAENIILCRQHYLVDLRSVFPDAQRVMSEVSQPAPIRFPHNVPLIYSNQSSFQKNWAPFTNSDGDLYFHTNLIPQTIYKLKPKPPSGYSTFSSPAEELSNLELAVRSPVKDNCVVLVTHQPKNPDGRRNLHQSTPFLEVVLCTFADAMTGECNVEDPENRLYIGLIHLRHDYRHYERRIITLNSTAPWNYVSVSNALLYCTYPYKYC